MNMTFHAHVGLACCVIITTLGQAVWLDNNGSGEHAHREQVNVHTHTHAHWEHVNMHTHVNMYIGKCTHR